MTAAPGCPIVADFDPLSPAYLDDPFRVLAALPLATAPVFNAPSIDPRRLRGHGTLRRHSGIREIARRLVTSRQRLARHTGPPAHNPVLLHRLAAHGYLFVFDLKI